VNDRLDFSPLSDAERKAAHERAWKAGAETDRPTPPPGDAEAPEKAAARLFGRPPDAMWSYQNAKSAILFWICRWNVVEDSQPDKEIRPLCWFVDGGWRFAHWPAPRPLYKLYEIQSNLNAPIVICEGEQAADAASRILPESVVTTSCGGAGAARESDWTPLAGRKGLIWPDNDEPGARYAQDVTKELRVLGCDVAVVDAATLAEIDSSGRESDFDPVGWDADNAISEWKDLSALRGAVVSLSKTVDPRPAYLSFGRYTMGPGGLTMSRWNGKTKRMETLRIAAPFEVLGLCRDPCGQGWGKMLCWRDADGLEHVRYVPDVATHGEPAVLCGTLADGGLLIDRAYQRELARYLCDAQVERRVTVVPRTGWHEVGRQLVFTLPGETIGQYGAERIILKDVAQHLYENRGTLDDWREGVGKLAQGQVLPTLAISAALSGPLLQLTGFEGGGVHFWGPSSTGKTTVLRMGASVWGPGDTDGYVRAWRATANGLEGAAAVATDTALVLDELGQIEARELAAALYFLSAGRGKARANRDGSLRESRSWRIVLLSSGELPVGAKLVEDKGRKARAGQEVRMLDIAASRQFGVFDHPGRDGDAARLAKACSRASSLVYGSAGPEFVRLLLAKHVSGEDVRSMVEDFVKAEVPHGADGQIIRAAQRFGLIAAAGELATELGVTGWRADEARAAATSEFGRWIEGRDGIEPAEVRQAIQQVRLFIEQHGDSRFDSLDSPDARPVLNRAGWRKGSGEDRRWMIPSENWKEVCAGLDPKFVAKVLAERGMLERGNDANAKVERIDGALKRVYVVAPRIFDGGSV
jgi:putative DNA primase/helicase